MKKLLQVLIIILTLSSICFASDVKVQLNGSVMDFTDSAGNRVDPQIINDRTMVPFRKIFNSLGVSDDHIIWQANTRTIIAEGADVTITLQIGNNQATKKIARREEKIILDSAPVIYQDRTLVPLRFIAESLGKEVAWDGANRTAIIIDYNYFINAIKQKSNALYSLLIKDYSKSMITLERKYFDELDSRNNNVAKISANINEVRYGENIVQNAMVNFSGTNELMQEIVKEGWGTLNFENTYNQNSILINALDAGSKKVLSNNNVYYSELNLNGDYKNNRYDTYKNLCNIQSSKINSQTFTSRKADFDKLLKLFKVATDGTLSTGDISLQSFVSTYFDITMLDSLAFDSSINRLYTFLNTQIFKYDISLEELCYDYTKVNVKIVPRSEELVIDLKLYNDYNECIEYLFTLRGGI